MADEKFRVTVRANDIELRGYVVGTRTLRKLADAVKPLGAMVVASPWDEEQDELDQRPHSRACGILRHSHGPSCSNDCPTCGGQ